MKHHVKQNKQISGRKLYAVTKNVVLKVYIYSRTSICIHTHKCSREEILGELEGAAEVENIVGGWIRAKFTSIRYKMSP